MEAPSIHMLHVGKDERESAGWPRVSVCMATYNGERFIREQVTSILTQLSPDDEIVAVDDASQDASVAILEDFRDPRIRIICQLENRGVLRTFERVFVKPLARSFSCQIRTIFGALTRSQQ